MKVFLMAERKNRVFRGGPKKGVSSRRTWVPKEEEVLMAGLKEIVQQGWKTDNGFKVGYLELLEQHMIRAFPNTDLRAMPHINSRIHVNASLMRYKCWPLFKDWIEVFGKDRATGEHDVDFVEAVNHTLNKTYIDDAQSFEDLETLNEDTECQAENMNVSQSHSSASESAKKVGSQKRKFEGNQYPMYELLGNYCKNTDSRLGEIAIRIGVEYDVAKAKKEVYATVNKVEGLTLHQKLFVADKLVKKSEDVYLLFTLPEAEQVEYV
ncbi:hypothetical protein BUALT_Bualt14G0078900 [Buddleja alternifolia]|uniref:Myb/SANT-like domain-containing protein n=1 Tax=Buddleja alternifolia TaxID=168488 RepID=A0AAV6WSV8_9LAMI|nr:hypothetical protein BUALT_Bualt14G0078900 [Buddleja alternifolia]